MRQDPSHSEFSALTHLFMSLVHKYVNLKEPYNQGIKEQVTTKTFFKKNNKLYIKSPTQQAKCAKEFFQIQSPICGVNFSNNISIIQVRVNEGKTNLTKPLKVLNHSLLPLHDLVISPYVKHPPLNLPPNFVPPCQAFLRKKFPHTWQGEEETLCLAFISFPIFKSSSLTFVVQTMNFQAKLPSHCF